MLVGVPKVVVRSVVIHDVRSVVTVKNNGGILTDIVGRIHDRCRRPRAARGLCAVLQVAAPLVIGEVERVAAVHGQRKDLVRTVNVGEG